MNKKYLIGVAAYDNRDLLEKCVESWNTFPEELNLHRGIFFDGEKWREKFGNFPEEYSSNLDFVLTLNNHVGVSGSWNQILKYGFEENDFDVVLICGSDVEFKSGYTEKYIKEFEEQECEFATARGFGFNCFAMTRKCYNIVGTFDENCFPAYMEDNDFATRVRISGLRWGDIGDPNLLEHYGSATIRKSIHYQHANNVTFPMIQRYLVRKWGIKDLAKIDEYSYLTPFNDPNLTIKDWSLNEEEYIYKKQVWMEH